MKKKSREIKILFLMLLPVLAVLILHQIATGFTVYNDGIGYYSYVRSAVIDQDIDFENEWTYYNSSYSKFSSIPRGYSYPLTRTSTGAVRNIYLIGSAVLWVPFFLAAHVATIVLSLLGVGLVPDGFGVLYEFSVSAASIVFGFIGIVLTYKLCRKWYDKRVSFLATVGIWYGTGVFWYHAVEPSMPHINSFFLHAVFIYYWLTTLGKRSMKGWFFLGVIVSLIFLVRQQETIILLLPAAEILRSLFGALKNESTRNAVVVQNVKKSLSFTAGIVPFFILQAIVFKKLYGQFIAYTYSSAEQSIGWWTYPHLLPFIFSTQGMVRIPVMVLAVIGLFYIARQRRFEGVLFLALVLIQIVVTSSWNAWNNGYGIRFLLGLSPIFALGFAYVLQQLIARFGIRKVYLFVGLLIVLNVISMVLFLLQEVIVKFPLAEVPGMLINAIL